MSSSSYSFLSLDDAIQSIFANNQDYYKALVKKAKQLEEQEVLQEQNGLFNNKSGNDLFVRRERRYEEEEEEIKTNMNKPVNEVPNAFKVKRVFSDNANSAATTTSTSTTTTTTKSTSTTTRSSTSDSEGNTDSWEKMEVAMKQVRTRPDQLQINAKKVKVCGNSEPKRKGKGNSYLNGAKTTSTSQARTSVNLNGNSNLQQHENRRKKPTDYRNFAQIAKAIMKRRKSDEKLQQVLSIQSECEHEIENTMKGRARILAEEELKLQRRMKIWRRKVKLLAELKRRWPKCLNGGEDNGKANTLTTPSLSITSTSRLTSSKSSSSFSSVPSKVGHSSINTQKISQTSQNSNNNSLYAKYCSKCLKTEYDENLIKCRGKCFNMFHDYCVEIEHEHQSGFRNSIKKFKCEECSSDKHRCFVCNSTNEDDDGDNETLKCSYNNCGKYYHIKCIDNKKYPARFSGELKDEFICPHHFCLHCHIQTKDNPLRELHTLNSKSSLKCVICPTAYHREDECIAAGTTVVIDNHVICPDHHRRFAKKKYERNISIDWCLKCQLGGNLISCATCPVSFHASCLDHFHDTALTFHCSNCKQRKQFHYDDLVWVKQGVFRWWPCRVEHPDAVPDNIIDIPHDVCEFPVYFFGSHDYYWTHKARCYEFEGCNKNPYISDMNEGSNLMRGSERDLKFKNGLQEASLLLAKKQEELKRKHDKMVNERQKLNPHKKQKNKRQVIITHLNKNESLEMKNESSNSISSPMSSLGTSRINQEESKSTQSTRQKKDNNFSSNSRLDDNKLLKRKNINQVVDCIKKKKKMQIKPPVHTYNQKLVRQSTKSTKFYKPKEKKKTYVLRNLTKSRQKFLARDDHVLSNSKSVQKSNLEITKKLRESHTNKSVSKKICKSSSIGENEDSLLSSSSNSSVNKSVLETPIANNAHGSEIEYAVESILGKRTCSDGHIEYLVKWVGYPHLESTWEPVSVFSFRMNEFEDRLKKKMGL